jgi:UDP-N-acetylmuramate dehydrogenase
MTTDKNVLEKLVKLDPGDIREKEPLKNHCTWRIGGPADVLIEPSSAENCSKVLAIAKEEKIPHIVIGRGSNLLFDDEGFHGIVIKIGRKISNFSIDGTTIRAGAGIAISRLARATGLAGLTGLEHTIGIPGTLGGLIVMNGGSQQKSIGDVIDWVKVMDHSGNIYNMPRKECNFSYRHSMFQKTDLIVIEAQMQLQHGNPAEIKSEMLTILRSRRTKFPNKLPNCGSVFMRDIELYSTFGPPGKIIEQAGLKGLRVGDAEVSQKHANFIINTGNAKASDVRELISQVRAAIHKKTNIWMKCEVKYVQADGQIKTSLTEKDFHR